MANVRALKATLRKEIKAKIATLTDAEKNRQSAIVTEKLLKLPEYQASHRISVFLSMSDEVQTKTILSDIFKSNKSCFIPRYTRSSMDMVRLYSFEDLESLPETSWKIKQPDIDDKRPNALDDGGLDLILMPGLAFTRQGHRLGRGKGYYDSYLENYKQQMGSIPATVALAYKQQICDFIPTSDHDVFIQTVLYEED